MGIPAIRESIVLHRRLGYFEGAKLLNAFVPNSGGGLRWFARFPLFSLPIVPNSGGDLWWFVVVCGGLWWFVLYSHTGVTGQE